MIGVSGIAMGDGVFGELRKNADAVERLRARFNRRGQFIVECWKTKAVNIIDRVRQIGERAAWDERLAFFKNKPNGATQALNLNIPHRIPYALKWRQKDNNLVLNGGLDYILDAGLSGGTPITSWYVGLLAATPSPIATWTATEIGTNDFVDYDEAALQAWTEAGVSSQLITNTASKAVFTISVNSSSIGGAFLISTSTKATPAGTVFSAVAFTGGNKAADDGDSLQVTYQITSADDGV